MRINKINNISFQRAIKIYTNADYCRSVENYKVTPFVQGVLQTMKSDYQYFDDKKTAQDIGSFLRNKIKDYNNRDFLIRNIENDAYIFTGKEARQVRTIDKDAKKEFEELHEQYYRDNIDKELYKIRKKNIFIRKDRKMLAMVENGEGEKPYTKLFFNQDETTKKLQSITYKSETRKNNKYEIESDSLVINKK